jgi:hypothetical protein
VLTADLLCNYLLYLANNAHHHRRKVRQFLCRKFSLTDRLIGVVIPAVSKAIINHNRLKAHVAPAVRL